MTTAQPRARPPAGTTSRTVTTGTVAGLYSTLEPVWTLRSEDKGPGGSLPGPGAGHPLQGAGGHGPVPNVKPWTDMDWSRNMAKAKTTGEVNQRSDRSFVGGVTTLIGTCLLTIRLGLYPIGRYLFGRHGPNPWGFHRGRASRDGYGSPPRSGLERPVPSRQRRRQHARLAASGSHPRQRSTGARFIAARDVSAVFATVDRVCTSGAVKLRLAASANDLVRVDPTAVGRERAHTALRARVATRRPRSVSLDVLRAQPCGSDAPGNAARRQGRWCRSLVAGFRVGMPSVWGRPAVVLGQDLAELLGGSATVRWQIWQRVTGSLVRSQGSGGNLTCSSLLCASPSGDLAVCHTHAPPPSKSKGTL